MSNRLQTLVAASFSFAAASFAAASFSAAPVMAQQCQFGKPVADLGFVYGYALRATNMAPSARGGAAGGATGVSMREEPKVINVEPTGPAAGKLQDGDHIARVNGLPITTPEGTSALHGARAGHSLVLTVRRADKLIPVTLAPTRTVCPTRSNAAALAAPAQRAQGISSVDVMEHGTAIVSGMTIDKVPFTTATAGPQTPGWLGLGFDCRDCSLRTTETGRVWSFAEPPAIYNVDTNGPAYTAGLRRGDVLLRVDGKDVQTQSAGARLGQARAGETLRLTYRRAGRTQEATLRVARNPALRETVVDAHADQLMRSAQELRASTKESTVREMISQLERARAVQDANYREAERKLRAQGLDAAELKQTLVALDKMRTSNEQASRNQERMLTEMLRAQQADIVRLNEVEEQIARTASVPLTVARAGTLMPDSAVTFARGATRDPRLRYSGSVGTANVEVRGPGSVSVQGDGDDIIIITSDATIRISARKLREQR